MITRKTLAILFSLLVVVTASCSQNPNDPEEIKEDSQQIRYEQVVDDFDIPWGMAFLPNGDWLITERKGDIRIVRNGKLLEEKIAGVPEVYERGQGGLLDIQLHPQFEQNNLLYLSYASQEGVGNGGNTAVMRARLEGTTLVERMVLYNAGPNTTSGNHFGSRLAFDKDGYLYFSVGDRHNRDVNPQDITKDGGKVYRIYDDGRIPDDNPFVTQSGAKGAIFSYGHRNPQGMAMNPATGDIWIHEHGPQGGDEVNLVCPGKNYGWPILSYGINYDGTTFAKGTERPGMEPPVIYWVPSIAPSGMTFITGDKYPGWEGDLIVGSLKFNYLVHCKVEGNKIVSQEIIADNIGRVRDVQQSPDGYLYVAVERKGIFRLVMD